MAKEMRTAAELAALIRARLQNPSGCTIEISPHHAGWNAQAKCRLDNGTALRAEVHQIAERLRMFYDLKS
jgi:hypothetical protein